jgi:RND family efflux transporter MFP subunit
MKHKIIIPVLVTLLAACSQGGNDKKAELEKLRTEQAELQAKITALEAEIAKTDTTAAKTRMVGVEPVALQQFRNYIEIQGKVDADENVTLSAEMGGTVTRINVKEGDEVHKGQVLAETDNKAIMQGMQEIQTQLDLATTLYQKQKNLWDQKIGTEMQYLQAKTQKEALEKRMATMQEQLDMTRIKSPIEGTVDAVDIKVGQITAPGMPAIRVVNFANMKVVGEVPEAYAGKVKKDNPVTVIFPDNKDTLNTKVAFVARVINPLNRTFKVEVVLDDKKGAEGYHPNMISIVKIADYTNEKAIVIPVSLIQKTESGDFVFVEKNGKAARKQVKYDHVYNGKAEITSGLEVNDKLIVSGYQDLDEGELVKF